jgi:hypothetical protein
MGEFFSNLSNGFVEGATGGFSGKTHGIGGVVGNTTANVGVGLLIGAAKTTLKFIPGVNIIANTAMGAYSGVQRYNAVKDQLSADGEFSIADKRNALLAGAADGLITTAVNSVVPVGGSVISNAIKGAALDGAASGASQIVTNAATDQQLHNGVATSVLSSAGMSGAFHGVSSLLQGLKKKSDPIKTNQPLHAHELKKAELSWQQGNQWAKDNLTSIKLNEKIPNEFIIAAHRRMQKNPVINLKGEMEVRKSQPETVEYLKDLSVNGKRKLKERHCVLPNGETIPITQLKLLHNGLYLLPNGQLIKPESLNFPHVNNGVSSHKPRSVKASSQEVIEPKSKSALSSDISPDELHANNLATFEEALAHVNRVFEMNKNAKEFWSDPKNNKELVLAEIMAASQNKQPIDIRKGLFWGVNSSTGNLHVLAQWKIAAYQQLARENDIGTSLHINPTTDQIIMQLHPGKAKKISPELFEKIANPPHVQRFRKHVSEEYLKDNYEVHLVPKIQSGEIPRI